MHSKRTFVLLYKINNHGQRNGFQVGGHGPRIQRLFLCSTRNDLIIQILGMEEFSQFSPMFIITMGYLSQMTMQYLKDVSMMLSMISAVRGGICKHLQVG